MKGDSMAAVRGPGGRFLSKAEAEQAEAVTEQATDNGSTTNHNKENSTMTDVLDDLEETATTDIEFVDELPKIHRKAEGGVWVERLAPLRDPSNHGRWAKVYGPTKNPHALVNNLRGGNAAGIDADEFQFAGRMLPTGEDEDGNAVKEGFVFARYLTEEQRAERDAKRAAGIEDEDEDE